MELGSGAGFLVERVGGLVTSDAFLLPGLRLAADARRLPFRDGSLRALLLTNVFHHVPDAAAFLAEAARCLRPGGVVAMVEPWLTRWSRLVYGRLHHEPCAPEAVDWAFPTTGPLSGANEALAWIVFSRDRERFARAFPSLAIRAIIPSMPLRYLVSGGVSMRALAPAFSFGLLRLLERALLALSGETAMFATIVLERTESAA